MALNGNYSFMIIQAVAERSGIYIQAKRTLITFGSPRVFSVNYEFKYPFDTYRFINNNDIVTRIPPRAFGFKHIGEVFYFLEDGEFYNDPSSWEMFLDRIKGRLDDLLELGTDGFKDHSMNHYLNLVNSNF